MFDLQIRRFRETHRVIVPELRGNGESGRISRPINTIIDRQCDDLARLLDSLEIHDVVMIGVSYGGAVAMQFALRHPGLLAGLVFADTFADIDKARIVEFLFFVASYLGLWVCYLPKPILKALARHWYRHWPAAQTAIPGLVEHFRPTEAVLQSLAMNRINYVPSLHQVRCPAMGIVGDATRTGIRLMERAMNVIAGSRLEIVPDSFDPTSLCQPEAFNRLLDGFLQEIGWCRSDSEVACRQD
jgi:pimeloyl-ACP methyl ester carboxylesterase